MYFKMNEKSLKTNYRLEVGDPYVLNFMHALNIFYRNLIKDDFLKVGYCVECDALKLFISDFEEILEDCSYKSSEIICDECTSFEDFILFEKGNFHRFQDFFKDKTTITLVNLIDGWRDDEKYLNLEESQEIKDFYNNWDRLDYSERKDRVNQHIHLDQLLEIKTNP